MLSHSPTQKYFLQRTNQMKVCKSFNANGFIRSGIVENLDEGDPEIIFYYKKLRA